MWGGRALPGSVRLQLYHKHHHYRFKPNSCPRQFIQHVIEVHSALSAQLSVPFTYAGKAAELHVLKLLRH